MFTGLIEAVGRIVNIQEVTGGRSFEIEAPFTTELTTGQSVAVDGACLTVTNSTSARFSVTAVGATLERTIAAEYALGGYVNLERALRVGERLDGHLVQGHVDGVAEFLGLEESSDSRALSFSLPEAVSRVTIPRGSVTLSGISLTVAGLSEAGICEVAIIPHTWEHTNLRELVPGDRVNVEGDLIGKYVERTLSSRSVRAGGTPGAS